MEHHGVRARNFVASRHVNFPLSRRDTIAVRRQRHVASAGESVVKFSPQITSLNTPNDDETSVIRP